MCVTISVFITCQANEELKVVKEKSQGINKQMQSLKADSQSRTRLVQETEKKMKALDGNGKRQLEESITKLRNEIDDMEVFDSFFFSIFVHYF